MCPEDGCLWVHGVGENGVPAFTRDGIENLRQIIADEACCRPRTAHQAAEMAHPAALTECLPLGHGGLDDRLDRLLLPLATMRSTTCHALDQAQDRRFILRQRAASRRSRQPAAASEPPPLATAAGWPLCPATT